MKHIILFMSFFVLFSNIGIAQSKYQPGYFIKKSGERVEVLIKNAGWKDNPTSIEYKISEDTAKLIQNTLILDEFGIYNESRYLVKNLPIDTSTKTVNNMGFNKYPVWENRDLVLNVGIESEISLYIYEGDGITRYYYSNEPEVYKQLVHKKYRSGDSNILENNEYKQQLLNIFSDCIELTQKDYQDLSYSYKSLTSIFTKYNNCVNGEVKNWTAVKDRAFIFNLKPHVGIFKNDYDIKNIASDNLGGDFGSQIGYRLALELEAIAPFNHKSFAFFFELGLTPSFEKTMDIQTSVPGLKQKATFVYDSSFDVSGGVRYYIPINNIFAFSINAGYQVEYLKKLSITYEISGDFETKNIAMPSFYGGLSFHANKIALNVRLPFNKEFTQNNFGANRANIKGVNATLSYEIL